MAINKECIKRKSTETGLEINNKFKLQNFPESGKYFEDKFIIMHLQKKCKVIFRDNKEGIKNKRKTAEEISATFYTEIQLKSFSRNYRSFDLH